MFPQFHVIRLSARAPFESLFPRDFYQVDEDEESQPQPPPPTSLKIEEINDEPEVPEVPEVPEPEHKEKEKDKCQQKARTKEWEKSIPTLLGKPLSHVHKVFSFIYDLK